MTGDVGTCPRCASLEADRAALLALGEAELALVVADDLERHREQHGEGASVTP